MGAAAVDGLDVSNYRNGFVVAYSDNNGAIRTRAVTTTGSLGATQMVDSDTASEVVTDLRLDPAHGRQLLTVFDAGEPYAIALGEGGARMAGTSFILIGTEVPTYARSSGDGRFGVIVAPDAEVRRFTMPDLVDQAPNEGPLAIEGSRVDGDAIGFSGGTYRYAHYFFTTTAIYSQSITCPASGSGTP
ncbi:MAG: hypothetical protein GWN73_29140 [Actinobacteria bacterium]|nr:hypothetical protein [Actinomycetota bacterium]NIS34473.1 hypothetical protein [Actinomycetota bacterium]NIU69243.1 hypothetical protein [Actinomycetota bacterium]NIW31112.1 hypothetical protein [Actinomycetota bacterium]